MRQLELALSLRLGAADDRSAVAWFVPGTSAAAWLTTVLEQGSSTGDLQFRPVGRAGEAVVGAIVSGVDCLPSHRWLPYVRIADRVLVPKASQLYPAVSESDLAELTESESVAEFVWHPSFGLVAFEPDQILSTADLLSILPERSADWDCTDPGQVICNRLVSVQAEESLSTELIFEAGRDDIGADADDISDAPRSPDESSSGAISNMISGMMKPLAHAAHWLARHAPSGANTPTWINAMNDWAGRILQHAGISQSKRMNELRRLMSLLDRNPDRGLRYALPFGGDAARGIANASNNLASRNIQYGAGSGGPADYWDMPHDVRRALIAKYRELAQREVSLGRYRRAAYIYATLLDDFPSAAQVLADGGYYREAAEVYRSKLKQMRKAADCLLKGGLWTEAIDIYVELKDWPAVADVYEKLEDKNAAREAWQKASEANADAGQYVKAARVQEERLHDDIAATDLLEYGWNHSTESKDCLTELFGLFARTENHANSQRWVHLLATDTRLPHRQQREVASLFADLSQQYPDADLRAMAFDQSRRIVARRLADSDDGNRKAFLSVLENLVPADKLLHRDCRSYTERQASLAVRTPAGRVNSLDRLQLRSDVEWASATRSGMTFFAAGFSNDSLVVASWHHELQPAIQYRSFYVRQERQIRILLVPVSERPGHVFLHVTQFAEAEVSDAGLDQDTTDIHPLPFFDSTVIAAGTGQNGTVWTLGIGFKGLEIRGSMERGSPIIRQTLPIDCSSLDPVSFLKPFADNTIACVVENMLVLVVPSSVVNTQLNTRDGEVTKMGIAGSEPTENSGSIEQFRLPGQAHAFSSFECSDSSKLAVTLDEGGLVHWIKSSQQQSFGEGLINAVNEFMANGDLIVADETGQIEIYRTRNNSLSLRHTHATGGKAVVAVLSVARPCHEHPTEFLLVHVDGRIDVLGYHS